MKLFVTRVALLALPVLCLAFANVAYSQMQGNPANGASLYESCVPCHTLMGKGIAGQPQEQLVKKMTGYQTGTFTAPKVVEMQKVLQPMSEQQILDLASYITKM